MSHRVGRVGRHPRGHRERVRAPCGGFGTGSLGMGNGSMLLGRGGGGGCSSTYTIDQHGYERLSLRLCVSFRLLKLRFHLSLLSRGTTDANHGASGVCCRRSLPRSFSCLRIYYAWFRNVEGRIATHLHCHFWVMRKHEVCRIE